MSVNFENIPQAFVLYLGDQTIQESGKAHKEIKTHHKRLEEQHKKKKIKDGKKTGMKSRAM